MTLQLALHFADSSKGEQGLALIPGSLSLGFTTLSPSRAETGTMWMVSTLSFGELAVLPS